MIRSENPLPGDASSMLAQLLGGNAGTGFAGMSGMPGGYSDAMAIPLAANRASLAADRDTIAAMHMALLRDQMDEAAQMQPAGNIQPMAPPAVTQLPPGSPGYDPPPGAAGPGMAGGTLGLSAGSPLSTGGLAGGGGDSLLALLGGGGGGGGGGGAGMDTGLGGAPPMPGMFPGPDDEGDEPQDLMSLLGGRGPMPGQSPMSGMPSVPPATPQPGATPFPTRRGPQR